MSKKVNLNRADKDELMSINGIGNEQAEAILAYREEYGKIDSVADLRSIDTFKKMNFDEIKNHLTVE